MPAPDRFPQRLDANNALFRTDSAAYLYHVPSLRIYKLDERAASASVRYFAAAPGERRRLLPLLDPEAAPFLARLEDTGAFERSLAGAREQVRQDDQAGSRVRALTLLLTPDCDLECRYCYSARQRPPAGERGRGMSRETAVRVIDLLDNSGCFDRRGTAVGFFGGEPLVRFPVLRSVVEHLEARSRGGSGPFNCNVTTNGLSLTAEKVRFLMEHNVRLRLSIDGEEEAHDRNRRTRGGQGSHAAVMENIAPLLAGRPDLVSVRATLTPDNIDLVRIDDFFHRAGIADFGFDIAVAPPGAPPFWTEEALDRLDRNYGLYARMLLELVQNGVRSGHGLPNLFARIEKIHRRQANVIPCRMGREMLAVAADGRFYPCHWLVDDARFCIGSAETGIDIARRRSFHPTLVCEKASCRACWARLLCDGACPAISWLQYGDDQRVDPGECRERQITWKWTVWLYVSLLERKIPVEQAALQVRSAGTGQP